MQRVHVDLAFRWFIGYQVDEKLPDHSTLFRALDRFGDEVFNELFVRSVSQCQASGLIEGKVLHIDATTIRADLDAGRVGKPDSPDPDARFGHFPGGKIKPGYKQNTVADGKRRVVVGIDVTPANVPEDRGMGALVDGVTDRLGVVPEVICADAAYGSGKNRSILRQRGIRLVSPPQTYTGDDQFTTEDFTYDKSRDEFVCPVGKRLRYIGTEPKRGRRRYAALRSECRLCDWKSCCTRYSRRELKVGFYHSGLIELRADSRTESFRQLYRSRAPVIEGVFAEAKQWHGLRRAWRCGLRKMLMQNLLVATVLNFKRLAACYCGLSALNTVCKTLINLVTRLVSQFWRPNTNIGRSAPVEYYAM